MDKRSSLERRRLFRKKHGADHKCRALRPFVHNTLIAIWIHSLMVKELSCKSCSMRHTRTKPEEGLPQTADITSKRCIYRCLTVLTASKHPDEWQESTFSATGAAALCTGCIPYVCELKTAHHETKIEHVHTQFAVARYQGHNRTHDRS